MAMASKTPFHCSYRSPSETGHDRGCWDKKQITSFANHCAKQKVQLSGQLSLIVENMKKNNNNNQSKRILGNSELNRQLTILSTFTGNNYFEQEQKKLCVRPM